MREYSMEAYAGLNQGQLREICKLEGLDFCEEFYKPYLSWVSSSIREDYNDECDKTLDNAYAKGYLEGQHQMSNALLELIQELTPQKLKSTLQKHLKETSVVYFIP